MGLFSIVFVYFPLLLLAIKIFSKFQITWCRSQTCLVGKTVIITGANSGIGYETALDLAKRGAKIILACRNEDKAKDACEKIIKETNNTNVTYKILDLSSLKSVREFANDINKTEKRLDILINNAGQGGSGERMTNDGLQLQMQVNYFSHFLLTNLLLDLLKQSAPSRVVNVSSIGAKYAKPLDLKNIGTNFPGDTSIYTQTKLCNILFTKELATKLKGTGVTTFSLHPGAVDTEIFRKMPGWMKSLLNILIQLFFKTATEGAQVSIYLAVQKNIEHLSGQHFEKCKPKPVSYKTAEEDPELPKKLWQTTAQLVKL